MRKRDKAIIQACAPGLARQAGLTRRSTPRSKLLAFMYFGALAGALAALAHGASLAFIMLIGASIYIIGRHEKETNT